MAGAAYKIIIVVVVLKATRSTRVKSLLMHFVTLGKVSRCFSFFFYYFIHNLVVNSISLI